MRRSSCQSAARFAGLVALSFAACVVQPASVASASPPRFVLSGSATLIPDAPVQRAPGWRLNAKLSPVTGPDVAPPAQSGGGFTLVAYTSLSSDVCYNDTIFRDDFDGDGL